jgi:hypothetical protein
MLCIRYVFYARKLDYDEYHLYTPRCHGVTSNNNSKRMRAMEPKKNLIHSLQEYFGYSYRTNETITFLYLVSFVYKIMPI